MARTTLTYGVPGALAIAAAIASIAGSPALVGAARGTDGDAGGVVAALVPSLTAATIGSAGNRSGVTSVVYDATLVIDAIIVVRNANAGPV